MKVNLSNEPVEDAAPTSADALAAAGVKATDSVLAFRQAVLDKLTYMVGKDPGHARDHDWLVATALVARDHIVDRWVDATRRTYRDGRKRVYYFSLEFLIGRLLFDALGNLGITDTARAALRGLEVDLDRLRALEPDAALGNGGLGRLAACFMESMATLGIPAHGYGIRYDHGIFRQVLRDGWQLELPEDWLSVRQSVGVRAARSRATRSASAAASRASRATTARRAIAGIRRRASTPSRSTRRSRAGAAGTSTRCGCGRRARPIPLRLDDFNRGDHVGALADRVRLEAISRVLYPSDDTAAGHELRLRQEFFFASASLQDLLRRHKQQHGELVSLADHVSIQLNDTHPAIAVPELMRLLVDEHANAVGARVDHDDVDLQLHEPHAAAGSASRRGPWRCSRTCCRGTCRSSISSTRCTSTRQRNAGHDDDAFLSSISMIEENHSAPRAGWGISRSWARAASTASRHCTPTSCGRRCSGT